MYFLLFAGQNREPFKIREQIKLEALDSDDEEQEKQPLAMASNSIFESFSSYQSCFSRGECPSRCFCASSYLRRRRCLRKKNDEAGLQCQWSTEILWLNLKTTGLWVTEYFTG